MAYVYSFTNLMGVAVTRASFESASSFCYEFRQDFRQPVLCNVHTVRVIGTVHWNASGRRAMVQYAGVIGPLAIINSLRRQFRHIMVQLSLFVLKLQIRAEVFSALCNPADCVTVLAITSQGRDSATQRLSDRKNT